MEQKDFNSIQANFKKFLTEKIHPSPKKVITEELQPKPSKRLITEIEKTTCFGSEDAEIGYEVSWTGKDGKVRRKLY